MEIILEAILWSIKCVLEIYFVLIIASIVIYWGMHFNFIEKTNPSFKKFLAFLHAITEPVYAKLREYIKPFQGFDLSPYVLFLVLAFVLHILGTTCQYLKGGIQ